MDWSSWYINGDNFVFLSTDFFIKDHDNKKIVYFKGHRMGHSEHDLKEFKWNLECDILVRNMKNKVYKGISETFDKIYT